MYVCIRMVFHIIYVYTHLLLQDMVQQQHFHEVILVPQVFLLTLLLL